ncbi:hypothetical protein Taro_045196 [Colocasia esculenta]|uniref:Uncharacterized protein n=1 Tax=Colocasia esculenta TaxID=4460 RepID=A0A843X696_COLES|nr:hypothetical protein [Colocasia esculenta]
MMKTQWLHGLHKRPQERGEYELDEEADDPEDPPHPNTFLARIVEAAEEEGEHGDMGQPHSSQFQAKAEDEMDLLGDLRIERAMPSRGGANLDDDVDFQRLMLGPATRSQSMREAPAFLTTKKEGVTYAICCSILSCERKGGGDILTCKGEEQRSSMWPSQSHCHTRVTCPNTKEEELVLLGIQEREKNGCPC